MASDLNETWLEALCGRTALCPASWAAPVVNLASSTNVSAASSWSGWPWLWANATKPQPETSDERYLFFDVLWTYWMQSCPTGWLVSIVTWSIDILGLQAFGSHWPSIKAYLALGAVFVFLTVLL